MFGYDEISMADYLEAQDRQKRQTGVWVPACGGTEEPFWTRMGRRLQYCWQPATGDHAYLDVQTDLILDDTEAQMALGN